MPKKPVVALDTNILLRWLVGDVPGQKQRVLDLVSQPDRRFHVADAAFFECEWVMRTYYELDRAIIAQLFSKVLKNPRINCNRALFTTVLEKYLEHPALSFVDLCLVGYVELSDAQHLLTFDKNLASQSDFAELLAG